MDVGARREDEAEDGGVDGEQQQRIQERPEIAEGAAAIAGGELAARQREDDRALVRDARERRDRIGAQAPRIYPIS
jgi:hypothetical protein